MHGGWDEDKEEKRRKKEKNANSKSNKARAFFKCGIVATYGTPFNIL